MNDSFPPLKAEIIDPIDDVQRAFEHFYTGGIYGDPLDGDWWSDDYGELIELTTRGETLSRQDAGALARRIERFNNDDRIPRICSRLIDKTADTPRALFDAYVSVTNQVNAINTDPKNVERDPHRLAIPAMEEPPYIEPLAREEIIAGLVAAVPRGQ